MAEKRPKGMATAIATIAIRRVPLKTGTAPKAPLEPT